MSIETLRVLVVDDNPTVRRNLGRILQTHGIVTTEAENGAAALLAVQGRQYDVIVCDIMMPVMDGMTFYDNLATTQPELARRVIFVSAWVDEPPVQEFLDRAGQPVLAKPFEMPLLIDAIRALGWTRAQRRSGRERRTGQDRRGS